MTKNKLTFLFSFIFSLTLLSQTLRAAQTVFLDPSAGACSDIGAANMGTGTCTISNVTGYQPSETVTFTATTAGVGATFSVSGSVSGAIGTVAAGSLAVVTDSYGLARFTVNLSNGGVAYQIGDNFSSVFSSGTELKKSNFDLFTLGQVCSNGCAAATALTATTVGLRDTSAAFDVVLGATSSSALSAGRTLTLDVVNANRAFKLGGDLTFANAFTTSGNFALTFTTTNTTNATLPSGTVTLVDLASSQVLTNKSIDASNNTLTNIGNSAIAAAAAISASKISFNNVTIQKFLSGSGTYTKPTSPAPLYIKVKMVGAGAGGWGSGTAAGSSPTAGGNSTFGSSFLTANGGAISSAINNTGGLGGSATINAGATGLAISGGNGGGSSFQSISTVAQTGAPGGASVFGGNGNGGGAGFAGTAGATNSGGGGGGGGGSSVANYNTGPGGGAGGYLEATITSISSTYAYSVGAAGSAGGAGTAGFAGGAGGSGAIIVEEYYQ